MLLSSAFRPLPTRLFPSRTPSIPLCSIRHASLNSAIGRGIRKSRVADEGPFRTSRAADKIIPRRSSRDNDFSKRRVKKRDAQSDTQAGSGKDGKHSAFDREEFIKTGKFQGMKFVPDPKMPKSTWPGSKVEASKEEDPPKMKRAGRMKLKRGVHRFTETMPEFLKHHIKVPDFISHATPASQFLYGTSAVEAALRCGRRQMYRLYIYQGDTDELGSNRSKLRKLALSKNIKVKMAYAGWDRLFDQMSSGRPHNGCILDASPLPVLPIKSLCAVPSLDVNEFRVTLAAQSREEALVNSTNDRIEIRHPPNRRRYPVIILLDGIVDKGNLGGIIRSAYYLGIDAIVFAGRNCAPLSPVTIKASAGAAENMPMLKVTNEVDFIQQSKANGWQFYAADAPVLGATYLDNFDMAMTRNPLTQAPSVLMLGSEGFGLSPHIKSQADSIVSIPGARAPTEWGTDSDPARVDSLNVSVAAAILMEMFLRMPLAVSEISNKSPK
ncbi:RNA methyltransferase [Aspergillus clavatus NRRL 1]|uniref:rRNA methyltransferase 1, mitochondrial n=1 Tax=Aspergillus clavatus (strain ATCC 1007 / CBS 513.65 / DSM 816 / NCTC 3887 / NRRL 1 / QM 1276 / 107) TaxID=344612 RepID=A1CIR5_ASPCL|nr:RNA methyltransferase, TrmH family [Aspergillus clavatus NRRL 1]EAW10770.1 RNA methyltransferase, TrmH family family [Aspergillus clavatus NRRL 1]